MPSRRVRTSLLATLLLSLLAVPARPQSAPEILDRALERFQDRAAGVENFTVTQDVMGVSNSIYFEKKTLDGHPYFQAVTDGGDGDEQLISHPYAFFPELKSRARLKGSGSVQGHDVWIVAVDDFSGLDLEQMGFSRGQGEFEPRRGTFYLDRSELVLRKVEMEGTAASDGKTHEVTLRATLSDYREHEGMLYPFRVDVHMEGMGDAMPPEDREKLEDLRERLEEMPEDQRKMAEQMLGPQIEQMEKMLDSGEVDFTVAVKDLKVNQGPPERETGGGS